VVRLVRTNEKFVSSKELEKNEKIGSALLNDSYLNKDSAFTTEEWKELGLNWTLLSSNNYFGRAGKTEIQTIRRTRQ